MACTPSATSSTPAGRAHVFTGSANATGAAFNGNVEFLVELVRVARVDLASRRCSAARKATRASGTCSRNSRRIPSRSMRRWKGFERRSSASGTRLVAAQFAAIVTETDQQFALRIEAKNTLQLETGAKVVCWPVTLGRGFAAELMCGRSGSNRAEAVVRSHHVVHRVRGHGSASDRKSSCSIFR